MSDPQPAELVLQRTEELIRATPPAATDPVAFLRAQYDSGLAWVHFPVGRGGLAVSAELQRAVDDRLADAGAPPSGKVSNPIGAGQIATTILTFGSDDQKQRYLRPIFSTEQYWCQLFSEPGSGSDLASLATRGERDGDVWIVNGQKVWTSGAHQSSYAIVLVRTDPDLEKHAGLTQFVVDMHAPGVEVRPLRQMSGGAEFNEVFLTDVRIPDSERLGEVGAGWSVSNTTLMAERYNMPQIPARGAGPIGLAVGLWSAREDKSSAQALALRDRLMEHWVDAEVVRLLQARAAALRAAGSAGAEGSLGKLAVAVAGRSLAAFTVDLLGMEGTLIDGYDDVSSDFGRRTYRGRWGAQRAFVGSPGMSIAGGTDDIQRNIIGERVLGLPREPAPDRGVPWSQTLRN
ncbi:MAG TPA: acyl-CoA dehydrogenase family protein [Acidimicrobiales bacterium]|nr:acyl-CoA dehydrogenase family protein [Acidimicrobiales bacterium]